MFSFVCEGKEPAKILEFLEWLSGGDLMNGDSTIEICGELRKNKLVFYFESSCAQWSLYTFR